jgi:hypothetical protein
MNVRSYDGYGHTVQILVIVVFGSNLLTWNNLEGCSTGMYCRCSGRTTTQQVGSSAGQSAAGLVPLPTAVSQEVALLIFSPSNHLLMQSLVPGRSHLMP